MLINKIFNRKDLNTDLLILAGTKPVDRIERDDCKTISIYIFLQNFHFIRPFFFYENVENVLYRAHFYLFERGFASIDSILRDLSGKGPQRPTRTTFFYSEVESPYKR